MRDMGCAPGGPPGQSRVKGRLRVSMGLRKQVLCLQRGTRCWSRAIGIWKRRVIAEEMEYLKGLSWWPSG